MSSHRYRTMSAKEAKMRFGELLDAALGHPVGITKHERLTAYMVSKRDFEALLSRVEQLEDKLLLAEAELARREGFVGAERTEAVLRDMTGDHADDASGDHTRSV